MRRKVKNLTRGGPTAMLTLTPNPARCSDPIELARRMKAARRELWRLIKKKYKLPALPFAIVWEATSNGWPHAHILIRAPFISQKWLKKQWKRLGNLLLRLDMNVIVTSHQKKLYGDGMMVVGNTYDGPKGLDYLFDLVFEVAKRGKERVGIVRKTRVEGFPEADVFPFSYAEVADRYGRAQLERDAAPVALATPEQCAELATLLESRKDGDVLLERWLTKAQAETLAELPSEVADKCIAFLNGKKEVAA